MDQYEDIEKSIELSEASGYNFERFKRQSKDDQGKYKPFEYYLSLKNISLQIKRGDLVCLTGKKGSGKTTLLQSILGETLYVDSETLGKRFTIYL